MNPLAILHSRLNTRLKWQCPKFMLPGDMCSQAVAAYLAKEFSLRYPESPIEFVKAELLDLGEDTPFPFRYMAIEPFIPGEYEKKTSNAGHIAKDSDLAQAFSHFTWDVTEGDQGLGLAIML